MLKNEFENPTAEFIQLETENILTDSDDPTDETESDSVGWEEEEEEFWYDLTKTLSIVFAISLISAYTIIT